MSTAEHRLEVVVAMRVAINFFLRDNGTGTLHESFRKYLRSVVGISPIAATLASIKQGATHLEYARVRNRVEMQQELYESRKNSPVIIATIDTKGGVHVENWFHVPAVAGGRGEVEVEQGRKEKVPPWRNVLVEAALDMIKDCPKHDACCENSPEK